MAMHKFYHVTNTIPIKHKWGVCVYSVAVLEPASGKLASRLQDFFLAQEPAAAPTITGGAQPDAFSGTYDLFVTATSDHIDAIVPGDLRCQALLVPGDSPMETVLQIPARWVVSFGLSGKDSITISSLEPDHAVLALQRELVTLNQRIVERQELPLHVPPGTSAAGVMAFYGALLLLDVTPEALHTAIHMPIV